MSPTFLTDDEQQAVLAWLARGASAMAALRQIGREFDDYFHTLRHDAAFRRRCHAVRLAIAGNVEAALYKQALEGKVAAQTAWLRLCGAGGSGDVRDPADLFDDLDDDELERLLLAKGVPLPPEAATDVGTPAGEEEPRRLPADAEPDE